MRLLNTKTRDLVWFNDGERPPYAILSHTWGPEELSLQDFLAWRQAADPTGTGSITVKAGFAKIDGACHVAAQLEAEWLWADTVGIDKSSSVEVSEAINSMFRWYQDAVCCIVYLSDVSGSLAQIHNDDSQLRASRWFTRGWTLQELLAPKHVRFFDRDWRMIADGSALGDLIQDITQINPEVFQGWPLASFSIAQRMSWAANRKTTRREDVAYCLLGIFEINMPLLYGEGDKAFYRLQEEIIKQKNDGTILAWGFGQPRADRSHIALEAAETTSALAKSPTDFAGCRDLAPFGNRNVDWGLLEISNSGLHLKLPIVRIKNVYDEGGDGNLEHIAALINCRQVGNPVDILALPVQVIQSSPMSEQTTLARKTNWNPFLSPLMRSHFAQVESCHLWVGDFKGHHDAVFPIDMLDHRAFIKASRHTTFEVMHADPCISVQLGAGYAIVYETELGQPKKLRRTYLFCSIAGLQSEDQVPFYLMVESSWHRSRWHAKWKRTIHTYLAVPDHMQGEHDAASLAGLDWTQSVDVSGGVITATRFSESRNMGDIFIRYAPRATLARRAHEFSAVVVDFAQHILAAGLIDIRPTRFSQRSAGLGGTLETGGWVLAGLGCFVLAIFSLRAATLEPSWSAPALFWTFGGNALLYLAFSRGAKVLRVALLLAVVTVPVWALMSRFTSRVTHLNSSK